MTKRSHRATSFIIFATLIIIGNSTNFFLRSKLSPVFNETELVLFAEDAIEKQGIKTPKEYWQKNWNSIWHISKNKTPQGLIQNSYRPLQEIITTYNILNFHIFYYKPLMPILFNSFILALAGGFLYLLGMKWIPTS